MGLFVSRRERRMWLSAACLLLLIYSTLNSARQIVDWLRERNMLRLTVALVLLIIAVILVRNLLRRRPGRAEVGVALAFFGAYAVMLVVMGRAEERLHLVQYGLVAAFIYRALMERREHDAGPAISPAVGAIVLTAAFGWLDEGIQALLPSRVYDLRDVAFNAVAGLLAVSAMVTLSWAARRDADRAAGRP
jgi:VanZ family protein